MLEWEKLFGRQEPVTETELDRFLARIRVLSRQIKDDPNLFRGATSFGERLDKIADLAPSIIPVAK